MIFVGRGGHDFIAAFPQNVLQEIKAGNPAELALAAIPWRVFHGKVDRIMPVLTELQLGPGDGATSFSVASMRSAKAAAVTRIDDNLSLRAAARMFRTSLRLHRKEQSYGNCSHDSFPHTGLGKLSLYSLNSGIVVILKYVGPQRPRVAALRGSKGTAFGFDRARICRESCHSLTTRGI